MAASQEEMLATMNSMQMSKKMQKKMKHLPSHIRQQLQEKMPDMDLSQLDQAGGMQALMRSGQNIAQRAIGQNVRDVKEIEGFLTQERTKQEIIESGQQVMHTMQQGEKTCQNCHKKIEGRMASCPRCTTVFYCNGSCRKQDYKIHKKACKPQTLVSD